MDGRIGGRPGSSDRWRLVCWKNIPTFASSMYICIVVENPVTVLQILGVFLVLSSVLSTITYQNPYSMYYQEYKTNVTQVRGVNTTL